MTIKFIVFNYLFNHDLKHLQKVSNYDYSFYKTVARGALHERPSTISSDKSNM